MELFPEFALDMITVTVPYPGAAPEEVEEGVCMRIEEEVHAINGVKRVTSTAVEGMGAVTIQLDRDANSQKVLDDVKTRVNAISTFPELAEKPIIDEILMRSQVINVAISGDADEVVLKRLGEQVRDEISALPGVSQVALASSRAYEVSIEITESNLQRYGLSFDEVAQAVRSSSLDLSAGTLKTDSGEVLLRAKGQAYKGEEFSEIVLVKNLDGSRILLGDVARIVDGFESTSKKGTFNSDPMVQVQVFRVGNENAVTVAEEVKEYLVDAQRRMPAGISLTVFSDQSVLLKGRLSLLAKNGLQGLFLVFAVLALFLRFRLAFWVTAGIPISFMGALWLMPALDQSINMLSLFAFILVLGIVVDDAIVIGESVFTEQKKDPNKCRAAIRGTNRVAIPVTFAVMTTVTAFAPMLDLPGLFGKFFRVFPLARHPDLAVLLGGIEGDPAGTPCPWRRARRALRKVPPLQLVDAHPGHVRERAGVHRTEDLSTRPRLLPALALPDSCDNHRGLHGHSRPGWRRLRSLHRLPQDIRRSDCCPADHAAGHGSRRNRGGRRKD